jgi:hypothetical protein
MLLSDPPTSLLRVPAVPTIEGARAFVEALEATPAIRWLPPDVPPPGPFHPDIPWDPPDAFPHIKEGRNAWQPNLFDWEGQ